MFETEAQFLEKIVKGIVNNPDDVRVLRSDDELGVLLTINARKEDLGCIIGREGHIADSLRTIMRSYGRLREMQISVKISDPSIV